jgi:hypothetical protein
VRSRIFSVWPSTWKPEGGVVTPEHYGAIGDGGADDTVPCQLAFRSGFPIALVNVYRITSAIMCGNGYGALSVYARGMGRRHFLVEGNINCIVWVGAVPGQFQADASIVLQDIVFSANSAGTTNAAVAISTPTGGSGSTIKQFKFVGLRMEGVSTSTGFAQGITIENGRNGLIDECSFFGRQTQTAGSRIGAAYVFYGNSDPVDTIIRACHAYFVGKAVHILQTAEGISVVTPYFIGVDYGVDVQSDENPISGNNAGKQLAVCVHGGHINYALYGVRVLRAWDWQVTNVTFLTEVANGNGIGIYGEMAEGLDQNAWIDGCKFQDRTTGAVSSGTTIGISLQGFSSGLLNSRIGMNWFTLLDHGIFLGTLAKGVRWEDASVFTACGSAVTNNGGGSNTAY